MQGKSRYVVFTDFAEFQSAEKRLKAVQRRVNTRQHALVPAR